MGKLSDILNGGNNDDFNSQWNATAAASDFCPVPKGVYDCLATKGELVSSHTKKTPGYRVEFTIDEGEFKGHKLWLDCWLTPAALPQAKRDLGKLGITTVDMMERPLPKGFRCRVTAVVRKDDDGIERNQVRGFDVLGIDKPASDPFEPPVIAKPQSDDKKEVLPSPPPKVIATPPATMSKPTKKSK